MKCPCCGREVSSNERYCSYCGQNNEDYLEPEVVVIENTSINNNGCNSQNQKTNINEEQDKQYKERRKELIKALNHDVKQLFTTKLALIKYDCKCKLRVQKKLTKEMFLTFSSHLIDWLKNENVATSDVIIPTCTTKSIDELRELIYIAANKTEYGIFKNNAVCMNGNGFINFFNVKCSNEHIKRLIPYLNEMALAMSC